MTDIQKPDMGKVWAENGEKTAPPDAKLDSGWGMEMMPFQYENWIQNRQDEALAYLMQKGIPEWDSSVEYQANKSFVQQSGTVWKAVGTNTDSLPTDSNSDWEKWGGDGGSMSASQIKELYELNANTNAFTDAEKEKLFGVAPEATKNATDAQLRDRATHTGVQPISSVSGLQTSLDGKVAVVAGKGLSTNDYTTPEKTKLAGVATEATKNSTDAVLLARTNHTGVQAMSTVSGLESALASKATTDVVTTTTNGLMSAQDKITLDNLEAGGGGGGGDASAANQLALQERVGNVADAAWESVGSGAIIPLLKRVALNGSAIHLTNTNGFNNTHTEITTTRTLLNNIIGDIESIKWSGTGDASLNSILRAIYGKLERNDAASTANFLTVTGSGSHPAGAYSVGFHNEGTGDMDVAGGTLSAGSSITFTARPSGTLTTITYNTNGQGNLRIGEVR